MRGESAGLRAEMRGEFAGLRAEMKTEFASLRIDMKAEFGGLRAEMKTEFAGVRSELAGIKTGIADLKVTLVAGFQSLPGRESFAEMLGLLRESVRLQAETLRLVAALVDRRGNGGPVA